ncbi:MAG: hypothetical protein RID23_01050 [Roseovarius sp.]
MSDATLPVLHVDPAGLLVTYMLHIMKLSFTNAAKQLPLSQYIFTNKAEIPVFIISTVPQCETT